MVTLAAAPGRRRQGGFTYLGVLFLVVLLGVGLGSAFEAWSFASQRAREKELLWVGNQYIRALKSYYQQSPGFRRYPQRLEDLLEDKRFPVPRRHLRQLYGDPITRGQAWGLLKSPDGRIVGLHSLSEEAPLKRGNFPSRGPDFSDKKKYSEWKFLADPGLVGVPPPSPAQQGGLKPLNSLGTLNQH